MWLLGLWKSLDVAFFLTVTLHMCHPAGAVSIDSSDVSLVRSVQDDVFFSVAVSCPCSPVIQWSFMSAAVRRSIGTWQPGGFTNISVDYVGRVKAYDNGSMGLSDLRLQDSGFYVVTVEDPAGSSTTAGFVLKVNEVLYEDLQYLAVAAFGLLCLAALLMLSMWLFHKACRWIKLWRQRRQMPENNATELQPL